MLGNDQQRIQPGNYFPPLQQSHRCPVQSTIFCKVFLGKAFSFAFAADAPAKCKENFGERLPTLILVGSLFWLHSTASCLPGFTECTSLKVSQGAGTHVSRRNG